MTGGSKKSGADPENAGWHGILDRLCPMHVLLDKSGHITHAGPTMQKLRPDAPLGGERFFERFELRRPHAVNSMDDLIASSGLKLHLRFRDVPTTAFKGVLMPLPREDGAIMNLSFGISVLDAVRDYRLTSADFAATDLAIEMLYLVEAKSAAMEASRRLNQRLQGAKIAAEEQAFTDTLTGLKNRRALDHVLGRVIETDAPFAVMHVDLDFFKAVNDRLGHAAGDHVLQEVARIMIDATRRGKDTVARTGGDEFVILFEGLIDRAALDRVALRIIGELEKPIRFEGHVCRVSASCGTALSSDYASPGVERIMADADAALYASKRQGRACHTFFSPDLLSLPAMPPTDLSGPPPRN